MKTLRFALIGLLILAGCVPQTSQAPPADSPDLKTSLSEARQGFTTKIVRQEPSAGAVPDPPPSVFRQVQYDAPSGKLAAYLTPPPRDGRQRPAIVWITGGDCNSIGDVWTDVPPADDQTAGAYRKAGLVMMFPSLRGGNANPGVREGFFGEVDDVLAATDFLAEQTYVDPQRIYLGGHSTGGALVMLVAACSDRYRAVFSFGPVEDVTGYGNEYCPFDIYSARERELRAPIRWLHSVKSPLFVFEGAQQPGNPEALTAMSQASKNALIRFHKVPGASHFSVLAPTNFLIASKILTDDGPTTNLAFTDEEFRRPRTK